MNGAVLTIGEGLGVLRNDADVPLVLSNTLGFSTGGAECNVAIGLARLGIAVTWVGRLGDDFVGRRVVRDLRGEGVNVREFVDPTAPTGMLLKEIVSSERTTITYYRTGSAGSRLSVADVEDIDLTGIGLVHVTGITPGLSQSAADAVRELVARSTLRGIPLSFDVNHRSRVWDASTAAPVYRFIARRATFVFAGEDEAAILAGAADGPEANARAIAAWGAREVVIKRGVHGALSLIDGVVEDVRAVPVPVVDTVGAGDAFVAGYLSGVAGGLSAQDRLRRAVRTGAAACRRAGDWEGALTKGELEQWDDEQGDPVSR